MPARLGLIPPPACHPAEGAQGVERRRGRAARRESFRRGPAGRLARRDDKQSCDTDAAFRRAEFRFRRDLVTGGWLRQQCWLGHGGLDIKGGDKNKLAMDIEDGRSAFDAGDGEGCCLVAPNAFLGNCGFEHFFIVDSECEGFEGEGQRGEGLEGENLEGSQGKRPPSGLEADPLRATLRRCGATSSWPEPRCLVPKVAWHRVGDGWSDTMTTL